MTTAKSLLQKSPIFKINSLTVVLTLKPEYYEARARAWWVRFLLCIRSSRVQFPATYGSPKLP